MSITRMITGGDVQVARNLKAIYMNKKGELNLTQKKMEKLMGMTQASISQYINGVITLNTDAVLAFAKVLRVHPGEIDPRLGRMLNALTKYIEPATIPIIGYASGSNKEPDTRTIRGEYGDHSFGIGIDVTNYAPTLEKGVTIIIDPLGIIRKERLVCYRRRNREKYEVAYMHDINEDTGTVLLSNPNDKIGEDKFEILLEDVSTLYAIVGYQAS